MKAVRDQSTNQREGRYNAEAPQTLSMDDKPLVPVRAEEFCLTDFISCAFYWRTGPRRTSAWTLNVVNGLVNFKTHKQIRLTTKRNFCRGYGWLSIEFVSLFVAAQVSNQWREGDARGRLIKIPPRDTKNTKQLLILNHFRISLIKAQRRFPANPPHTQQRHIIYIADRYLQNRANLKYKMTTLEDLAKQPPTDDFADLDDDILRSSTDDIFNRTKLIENEIKVCRIAGGSLRQ